MSVFDCGHIHTYARELPDWPHWRSILGTKSIITPLREPKETWKSWVNRWNLKRGEVELYLFEEQWKHLEAYFKEYVITFIPVELLGQRVGHIDAPDTDYFCPATYEQPDWDYIYSLPFVKKYYAVGI